MHDVQFIRRRKAGAYLIEKYGFGAERSLAKGVVTGDTPEFHKAGRIVLYTREALDAWALSKIRGPVRSTSERPPQGTAPGKRGRPAGAKLTEVAPLSPPMIRVTYTGFAVPVKLARLAAALNAYRKVPVGLISAFRLTPLITPAKVKDPFGCFVKEPGGIVVVKVPT